MRYRLHRRMDIACLIVVSMLCIFSGLAVADAPRTWEEKYREEPYIVLLSERTVEIRKDFTTLSTARLVAKIQKEGAKHLGEIPITYDKSREEVKDIHAFTITPEGEKLQYKDIQELNAKKDFASYSDERTKMVTMPHIVVGSTIDWKTTVETRKPVVPNNFYDMVYLSSKIPVKTLRYTLIVPKDMALHFKQVNTDKKPVVTHADGKVIYAWEVTNGEKIETEEYMPSWDEVYEVVAVSTLNSWDDMATWAWGLFRKNLLLSGDMKKKVREVIKGKESPPEKIQAVIDYIRKEFRYVSMNIDFHSYEPHPADQVFAAKYGDCKDYTLLGMAMLSEIGVQAYPVLVSSGRSFNGEHLLPMPRYFNHAILSFDIGGKRYYNDLLEKGYGLFEIPDALSGKKVFVLNEKGGFFDTIPRLDEAESMTVEEEHAVIRDDGNAIVETMITLPRNLSVEMREDFKNMPEDVRQKMFSTFEASLAPGGKVLEREWKNLETSHGKIIVRLKYESVNWAQRVGNMLLFGMPQQKRNMIFTAAQRKYPIVFLTGSKEEKRVTYTIPNGYEVVNLPGKVGLNYDFASYERAYEVNGKKLSGRESFGYKESRTPASQYHTVRDFLDDITRKTNDLIMIRKKTATELSGITD